MKSVGIGCKIVLQWNYELGQVRAFLTKFIIKIIWLIYKVGKKVCPCEKNAMENLG